LSKGKKVGSLCLFQTISFDSLFPAQQRAWRPIVLASIDIMQHQTRLKTLEGRVISSSNTI
jgi:hypothetical protein